MDISEAKEIVERVSNARKAISAVIAAEKAIMAIGLNDDFDIERAFAALASSIDGISAVIDSAKVKEAKAAIRAHKAAAKRQAKANQDAKAQAAAAIEAQSFVAKVRRGAKVTNFAMLPEHFQAALLAEGIAV